MKTAPTLADRAGTISRAPATGNPIERGMAAFAARVLRSRLALLEHGQVTLVADGRRETFGRRTGRCPLQCAVHVRDARFFAEIAFGGSVGAGESFMAGDWWTDDLTALVRIMAVNRAVLEGMDGGFTRVADLARRVLHAAARNTRTGSRRNIAAHYDIGNDFFERMLDETMMYSCAFFERPDATLHDAQLAKLDRLCRKLDLQPSDHLLEIGTGWGALALHAATHYGCSVTTTTISREQHALATERVRAAGLQDRVTVLLQDYRDLGGRYDKLVSVEMIEAVGHQYIETFFRRCGELLAPGGTMVLQSITIDDRQYAGARDSVDFIKRHIFPGCCIPSVGALVPAIVRASALRVVDLQDIGPHYARTLALWRENLLANAEALRGSGYPDALLRMFDFYLSYCEGGFAERALGNVQVVLQDTRRAVAPPPRV
jgi:cyclopropane-fatty-acyl-phospholipid synthase